ncbi:MAG: hypothetical protein LBP55_01730, partial [Candidatus Adiutrix sp.]|nr:hypothetical protein [Candidatus Adiutrix sp.]
RLVAENVSVAGSGTFIAQDGALNILVGKLNVAEKASILLEGYNQYSQVQFEEVYLGAGATFASAFSFCLADKNLLELSYGGYYYVGTLYVQQGATLTNPSWSGSYNPAGANSKIIFEEVNAHSLKGELNYTPVLNLGDDTNLDLSGSGSYNLQVNFAPEADIHHLYNPVKADHNLVLVQATGVGSSVIGLNKGYLKTEDYGLLEYNFNFSTNDDGLAFRTRGDKSTWISASSGYRLSPYSEAALAGLYTVMKSQQYLDSNIYDLARKLPPETVGVGLTLGGGSFRNHTGSHVDLDMYGANLALAYKTFNEAGQTTVGAFVEAGQGDYDTQNAVPVFGALAGDGETKFIGGGIFAHQVFSGEYEGAYAEASFRFGRVDNELDSIRGGRFNTVRGHERSGFDTDFGYLGAHGGLGYKWQPEGVDGLVDLYGKFFWTRLRNDSVTNGLGQYVHFNTIDSYHSRLGGRYTFAALTGLDAYVGAAWDHEFEGQAAGHVEGIKILNAGELKGSSAFFEGGLKFNPLDSENVSLDLGVFGQTGNERGIGGTAGLRIAF